MWLVKETQRVYVRVMLFYHHRAVETDRLQVIHDIWLYSSLIQQQRQFTADESVTATKCNTAAKLATHTQPFLRLSGFCLGQLEWAGTKRNIHPLTLIVVINHPLCAFSIYYDPRHPPYSIHVLYSLFHNLSRSLLWSTSWPGTLHFTLHTFLHPIIVFFSQHMPIPLQPVSL